MSVVSYIFIVFLAVTVLIYYIVPKKIQWWVLLAASVVFYAYSGIDDLLIVVGTAFLVYPLTMLMEKNLEEQDRLLLDADKEGFLRSKRSLIQTMGRCARNANGHVIMYADTITESMKLAMEETKRRRSIQEEYNKKHNIVPKTIIKEIRDNISNVDKTNLEKSSKNDIISVESIEDIEKEMKEAAKKLDFERAMELRDILFELKSK